MNAKFISIFSTAIMMLLAACGETEIKKEPINPVSDETAKPDTTKKSIPSEVSEKIGNTVFKINYHSPGVRGRIIWGGLVPYGQVWVTGAHMATALEVNGDFEAGGKKIPAGKYALFTIPGKEEWVVIINKNWNQHLTDNYDEKEDIVRIKVKPETTTHTERLKYSIKGAGNAEAMISISWEKIRIAFPVKITP
jgi:hypothetical protein